jgi:hypothetical protein
VATFYFHIEDGAERTADRFGVELADIQAARIEATVLAGELLRDRPDAFWGVRSWTMTVEDETGTTLFSIHVAAEENPAIIQLRG